MLISWYFLCFYEIPLNFTKVTKLMRISLNFPKFSEFHGLGGFCPPPSRWRPPAAGRRMTWRLRLVMTRVKNAHTRTLRITLHYSTVHYITVHCITLHHITLHYIILYYIILHYITLYYRNAARNPPGLWATGPKLGCVSRRGDRARGLVACDGVWFGCV